MTINDYKNQNSRREVNKMKTREDKHEDKHKKNAKPSVKSAKNTESKTAGMKQTGQKPSSKKQTVKNTARKNNAVNNADSAVKTKNAGKNNAAKNHNDKNKNKSKNKNTMKTKNASTASDRKPITSGSGRRGHGNAQRRPVCSRQHVVPRFIVSGFNDSENSAWVNTTNGLIIHSGPSGKYYWENNIYGKNLDDSWRGYEGFASNTIGTIRAGGNTVDGRSYWFSLKPYIAGLIARDRYAHAEFARTDWYKHSYKLDADAVRILLFSATLTALAAANIAIMRTRRSFILNDSGYAWDDEDERLLIPVSSDTMLVVSWPDTSLSGQTLIAFKDTFTLRTVRRDATVVNSMIALQAHQVTATYRDDAERYEPLGVDHGFMKWLTGWLPARAIWDWTYPVAVLSAAIALKGHAAAPDADYIPDAIRSGTVNGSRENGIKLLEGVSKPHEALRALGHQITWRPPYILLPDDAMLIRLIRGTESGLIMDMDRVHWSPPQFSWEARPDIPLH